MPPLPYLRARRPAPIYPITLTSGGAFDRWFQELDAGIPRRSPPSSRRYEEPILCECCGEQAQSSSDIWGPVNPMVLLPCGCQCLEWCLERILGPESREENCPGCGFHLLKWEDRVQNLEMWLQGLEVVDVQTMDEEDRCCAICHEEFAGGDAADVKQGEDGEKGKEGRAAEMDEDAIPEHPIRVKPCNHVFGSQCLKSWLSPAPEGADSNTCPACRQVLFPRHGEEAEEEYEGEGWFTVHQGFS